MATNILNPSHNSPCKYKLIYFNFRWIAEPIRYLLSYVGEEFEDVRLTWDDWEGGKCDKSAYRYAKLPILEEKARDSAGSDTTIMSLSQSFSILRYLGRKYNLVGKNLSEEAKCDEISDCIKDIVHAVEEMEEVSLKDMKRRSEMRATILNVTIPRFFSVFEAELKTYRQKDQANTKAGSEVVATSMTMPMPLVGNSITWVDFQLAHFSQEFQTYFMNKKNLPENATDADCQGQWLDAYPLIKEHKKWVYGLKGVREWRERRPVSEY